MSRLASFRGPSTPSSSPVKQPISPASPSRQSDSTYHRRLKTYLQELRAITETWDDLVILDGLKSVKHLVDARTDLDNALVLVPGRQPRSHVVAPKMALIEKCLQELDAILKKLQKLFRRMNAVMDNMDALVTEAQKTKGWKWVEEEPLWTTWSLEKFVTCFAEVIPAYHRSLALHTQLVDKLRNNSASFEESREAIATWIEQPWLEESGWDAKWEDICAVEVERWENLK
ncbi:hypothetical protein M378DRAFT_156815 [Amanita muscaria Koide BX008]|uniref:Uncharacterized protein n=1 Tax=Amanita muscaria (strain Koide BX008) TaxID=946122 RepID=A0A0C2T1D0_AMAMK|nr:hypothetical protein M378DRAFT_156815 [Amanita muscaria Koide BX008]